LQGQVTIKGYIQNENGVVIPGCVIRESGSTNGTFSNQNGQFTIQVQNNSSIIEISNLGFNPLAIKVDSINHDNLCITLKEYIPDEVYIIAPNPPYIELGYRGLIANQPLGLHIGYSTWGDKFRSSLDISTSDLTMNFYSFEIGPYRFGKSKFYKIINLYVKGLVLQTNSDIFICNRFYIWDNFTINVGIGNDYRNHLENQLIFLTGIKGFLGLPLPFLTNYYSLDFAYNRYELYWSIFLYTEFYKKNYKNLSLGVGYQKFYDQKDVVVNLNYKYYLFKR